MNSNTQPSIKRQEKASQGPAWGLKEQLERRRSGRRKQGHHDDSSVTQQRSAASKIRVSVTGPSLAKKIEEHFGHDKSRSHREVLGFCAKEVDKTVSVLVQRVKAKLLDTVERMDARLLTIEDSTRRLCKATENKGRRLIRLAKRTADSEREEKAILCQWLNGFLVGTASEPRLSSMDFTFARFALNMAMASSRTRPEVMLDAGAPSFLVGMLSSPNELVSGPAVMALSQMAQHEECQRALGVAGGIPPLVLLCFTSQSPAVLAQACISLAQLSRYAPNKSIVAGKGGVAAVVRLLEGYRKEDRVSTQVIRQALSTLVNVTYRSDANRGLAEECGLTSPTIAIMDAVDDENVLVQACLALANVSYGNQYAALRLLEAGADRAVCDLVRDSDKTKHSDMMEAAFICLANLANNELNQAHVGAGSAVELAIAVCKHCESGRVVRAAALALCSLSLKCHANKTRCASLDALPVLLELGVAWGVSEESDGDSINSRRRSSSSGPPPPTPLMASEKAASDRLRDEAEVAAAAQAICCLAILMQHPSSVLVMKQLGGLRHLTELILDSEHNEVITTAAKAVVILMPEPEALLRTFRSGQVSEVEEAGAHEALVRAREWAFGRRPAPSWLKYGLDVLGCEVEELGGRLEKEGAEAFRKPRELFSHTEFFEERVTVIPPDVSLAGDEDLGGMLFHVF